MASEAKDRHAEAMEQFKRCTEAEQHNRETGLADIRFSREGLQWDQRISKERRDEGRPMLTINRLPAFMRQVVNDVRQNKPSIKVHPVDDGADIETAEVISDLIRHIEYSSDADVAYDTAVENAITNGFGYWRVTADYSYDDSFDQDLKIVRVRNPFSVFKDPDSQAADSSDWNLAFITDRYSKEQFQREWGKKKELTSFEDKNAWGGDEWLHGDDVIVAERWTREEIERPIVLLDNGTVLAKADLEKDADLQILLHEGLVKVKAQRMAKSYKVTQDFMSGADILETRDWLGRYIPIVPVYGDEFDIQGKVYHRSLIHDAVDSQRNYNYWSTTATELVALAPRVPFIGAKGSFTTDAARWATVNRQNHPYLEYDPVSNAGPPQRQPLDTGGAASAMQLALASTDDMKSIMGIYDASLGAQSNETSGKAIMARQREGDVSTFHFTDNMTRAIRHTGRILIDLIPHYYNSARILRVRGPEGDQRDVPVNQSYQQTDPETQRPLMIPQGGSAPVPMPQGAQVMPHPMQPDQSVVVGPDQQLMGVPVMALHDLTAGKYDLTVTAGPSYTTRRQEAADQMMQLIQAFPQAAQVAGDLLVKNLDWPGADELAKRLKTLVPQPQQGLPPEVQQMIEQGKQTIAQLTQENQQLKTSQQAALAKVQQAEMDSQRKAATTQQDNTLRASTAQAQLDIEGYDAETRRIAALAAAATAIIPPPITNADAPRT
jgi:hypothetical protein